MGEPPPDPGNSEFIRSRLPVSAVRAQAEVTGWLARSDRTRGFANPYGVAAVVVGGLAALCVGTTYVVPKCDETQLRDDEPPPAECEKPDLTKLWRPKLIPASAVNGFAGEAAGHTDETAQQRDVPSRLDPLVTVRGDGLTRIQAEVKVGGAADVAVRANLDAVTLPVLDAVGLYQGKHRRADQPQSLVEVDVALLGTPLLGVRLL